MLIGDELFSNWPTELDEPADNSPEFERQSNAIRAALGLYAVHQRSKKQGVAQKVSERSKPTYDFWACVQKD